jgi:hypothetical protein
LRQEKWQGCYIRSKIQWAEEGEKPFWPLSNNFTIETKWFYTW